LGAFIEGTFILQALVYSQDIAAIPSVTAKTIIVHLSSLPFYVIIKSPEGLMNFYVIFHDIIIYAIPVFYIS
jgi:hypothetical protein